jgi:photosystem II 13kDa protein
MTADSKIKATIQLARGVAEEADDIKISRSKDGSTSVAAFTFASPKCMTAEAAGAEITGMYMVDEEGEIVTRNVNASFIDGRPAGIKATYKITTDYDWERFLRFMDRYAADNGMALNKAAE